MTRLDDFLNWRPYKTGRKGKNGKIDKREALIRMSRVDFFLKINKLACPFIRDLKVCSRKSKILRMTLLLIYRFYLHSFWYAQNFKLLLLRDIYTSNFSFVKISKLFCPCRTFFSQNFLYIIQVIYHFINELCLFIQAKGNFILKSGDSSKGKLQTLMFHQITATGLFTRAK